MASLVLWRRARRSVAALGVAAAVVGCELLVPDSLPPYTCGPGAGACPTGMTCDPPSQLCVESQDVISGVDVVDTGTPDVPSDTVTMMDVQNDTTTCTTLGCTCSGGSDCASKICADQTTVTPTLYNEVGHGFCIQSCCTSSDCPSGFVCFATDSGGNYCVAPSLVGRTTTLGTAIGGTSCGADSTCRSGICSTTCQDTCCSMFTSGECANACRFGTFPGKNSVDMHFVAHCTTSGGSGGDGSGCGSNGTCKSDLCVGTCVDECRNSSECSNGNACTYVTDTQSDIITACFANGGGSTTVGNPCTSTANCATAVCDPVTSMCTNACYTNADCSAVTGWFCRPELLQVQGGGFASVLLCGT